MFIDYTLTACSLGRLLLAATERGVCALCLGDDDADLTAHLKLEHPAAKVQRDDVRLRPWIAALRRHLEGRQPYLDWPLHVRATAFQRRVWQELQAIPYGQTCSYRALAAASGQPTAVRAVARACAANPVAIVVPCHRVLRSDGKLGGYRWGLQRKRALLALEAHVGNLTADGRFPKWKEYA